MQEKSRNALQLIMFWVIIAVALTIILWASVTYQYVPKNDIESQYEFHDLTAIVRRDSPILIPLKNAWNNYTSHIQVIIYHKPSSDFTISHVKLSSTTDSILSYSGPFKNATKATNATKTISESFKNATKATNATNANITPTPIVETYDMVVVAKHNLEVSNTTRPYTIDIFSLNKTTIPIAQNQTRTILNAINATKNVILNQTNAFTNKTSTKTGVPTNKTAVSTTTTDPPPSLNTKAIRPIKTGSKISAPNMTSVNTTKIPIKTGSKTPTTLSEASIPFNWSIQTMDFGQLTYFFIVLVGVIVSRFYQVSQQNQSNRKITSEDFLWAGISAIIALLVFSNFQQQVTLTRHIITNISLAFGFGFGFDRVLQTIKK